MNRRWLPPPTPADPPVVTFTVRQADVLAYVCRGLSNQQIATRIYVDEKRGRTA